MNSKAKISKPRPDWEFVARDYVAGVLTLKQICEKHSKNGVHMQHSGLLYQMKKRGYHKKRLEVKAKLNNQPLPESQSLDVIADNTAKALQLITQRHVEGLRRTQHIVDVMLADIGGCIEHLFKCKDPSKIKRPAFLGERETVADYVRKLGECQTKLVTLERKCLGLDKELPSDQVKSYEERLKDLHDVSPELPEPDDVFEGEFTEVKH